MTFLSLLAAIEKGQTQTFYKDFHEGKQVRSSPHFIINCTIIKENPTGQTIDPSRKLDQIRHINPVSSVIRGI